MLARPSAFFVALLCCAGATSARAEVILQYFETPWAEIEARMPEIALAGYDALWLPPPTKGTEGVRDVGFAVYDRFDLGDTDARGTVPTRYGSKVELRSMVQTAHRFGVRVYFDVVMNHNGNPNGIENVGVSLEPVALEDFPGTSVWDYHVLPARPGDGSCAGQGGCSGAAYCAYQPNFAIDDDFNDGVFDGKQSRVLAADGSYLGGGVEVCVGPDGGETRVDAMTIAEAMLEEDAPAEVPSVFAGYTHVIRAPRMGNFDDFGFEVSNWALLGLHDFATEQYEDGDGPTALDGTNAVIGTQLPRFVRDVARPQTYEYEDNPNPHEEDIRQYMMRWIRWLMLETEADGFRLDAIKHIWPNFYGSDFAGDEVAFVTVIQDTYDEMHGFTDVDDADLVDDAAVFGEDFTGSCGALKPYILTGMRALDFPLFFSLGDLMAGGDIGQYSAPAGDSCADATVGAFRGLNRRSGVAFAQSHDECQKHETVDTDNESATFSRCTARADFSTAKPDLVYAYILAREADAAVFYDGNRWSNLSFVRSGRPDALLEVAAGQTLDTLPVLVNAARRTARGSMQNRWVGSDGYAFERVVAGAGAAGLVVLNDRLGATTWGASSTENSFIVTSFPPGTELCELTGTALDFSSGCYAVLDPQAQRDALEGTQVDNAIANFQAANGAVPQGNFGVFYAGLSGGSYASYAPPAVRAPSDAGEVDVVEALAVDVSGLNPGVHALHVRFRRAVAGAADAQDEFIVPVCVPSAAGPELCGPAVTASPPASDPLTSGLLQLRVDGSAATRRAVQTAPSRTLPDGRAVSATRAFHVLLDGDTLDIIVTSDGALAVDDIAVRLDDSALGVPGFLLEDTAERFLDGFTKLLPPGVTPPDSGVVGEGEGEGEGEPDAGPVDPEGDDDGDDVRNSADNCQVDANPAQEDFDEDGVGDDCDVCVLEGSIEGEGVDATGCRPVSADERARIESIARAIAVRAAPIATTDVDGSGTVNVLDLDKAIAEAHQ